MLEIAAGIILAVIVLFFAPALLWGIAWIAIIGLALALILAVVTAFGPVGILTIMGVIFIVWVLQLSSGVRPSQEPSKNTSDNQQAVSRLEKQPEIWTSKKKLITFAALAVLVVLVGFISPDAAKIFLALLLFALMLPALLIFVLMELFLSYTDAGRADSEWKGLLLHFLVVRHLGGNNYLRFLRALTSFSLNDKKRFRRRQRLNDLIDKAKTSEKLEVQNRREKNLIEAKKREELLLEKVKIEKKKSQQQVANTVSFLNNQLSRKLTGFLELNLVKVTALDTNISVLDTRGETMAELQVIAGDKSSEKANRWGLQKIIGWEKDSVRVHMSENTRDEFVIPTSAIRLIRKHVRLRFL